ncbi:MAG: hypothetical protein CTY35_03535 [Methylotenera sp.]|nr:MAG: hypothetical protein CTY35_03535 [Methylotenera sp.]
MKRSTLKMAVEEAKRFVERAEVLMLNHPMNAYDSLYEKPREQGDVKRASMDLTRKLADLRQGR